MSSMNGLPDNSTGTANHSPESENMDWYINQVKGAAPMEATDADLISCVQFNKDGDMLAVGDKGGRITLLKRQSLYDAGAESPRIEYSLYTAFTSHEAEFDYLKSLEIEEKINNIRWLPHRHQNTQFLLSTNDKTIKLWRIRERFRRDPIDLNFAGELMHSSLEEKRAHIQSQGYVRLPRASPATLQRMQNGSSTTSSESLRPTPASPLHATPGTHEVEASAKHVFANAHAYHINSLSVNSDQETFLSSDDLRINLWHFSRTDQSFNIVDLKPANMEDLTEVITAAEFHPKHCALFTYSTSKGTISLCDMRVNALCDKQVLAFAEPDDLSNRSFFSEIINSISDMAFSSTGDYILIRDYLTLKVWDVRVTNKPVECYPVHEYFRSKLCTLYENDCIFDKFECCWSPDDRFVMTGSYNNFLRVFDRTSSEAQLTLEMSRDVGRHDPLLNRQVVAVYPRGIAAPQEVHVDSLDFSKKLLHVHWNPSNAGLETAASTAHQLYLLSRRPSPPRGGVAAGGETGRRQESVDEFEESGSGMVVWDVIGEEEADMEAVPEDLTEEGGRLTTRDTPMEID